MDYAKEMLSPKPPSMPSRDYASEILSPNDRIGLQGSVMNPVQSESSGAPFTTLAKAAAVDDPETRIRIFAKDRFPKMKEDDALSRYGVVNGEIVYLDTDGKIKKESPSGFTGFVKELGAGIVGQAPSVVGSTVGAVLGAAGGPLAAAGGAALGAAGGKGVSQVIANLGFDEPQSVGGNVAGMAKEGGINAAFTFVGSKLAQWMKERGLSRDISRLNRPEAESLQRKASDMGVNLGVAEATNLPSLKARAEVLGRLEGSSDIMDAARLANANAAANKVGQFTSGLSGVGSVREAGERGRTGANAILDRIAGDQALAARPWYEKALNVQVKPDEQLQLIADTPAFKSAFDRAKRIAANEGIDIGDAANNMRALHYVKLGLDDLIGSAGKEGVGNTERRAIIGVKDRLLKFMDSASSDYARARSIYGHYMPTLGKSRDGLIGELADLADTDVSSAAKRVFSPQNAPEDVAKLRSMFYRYDQGNSWNAMLSSYLKDTFDTAGREFQTVGGIRRQAPSWRAMMAGNPKQLANIRAAMTADQFSGFQDMMQVFEAMGRVAGSGGSPTMPLTVAANQLREEAAGIIPKALAPRESVRTWLMEARLGKHAEEMAKVMTSPDGLKKLRQLRQMTTNEKQFVAGFSSLFGIEGQSEDTPEDRPIKAR